MLEAGERHRKTAKNNCNSGKSKLHNSQHLIKEQIRNETILQEH